MTAQEMTYPMDANEGDFQVSDPSMSFHNGQPYLIRTCSEFIEGRWESFISMEKMKTYKA